MSDDPRPYLRMMRAGDSGLQLDIFYRNGDEGARVDVNTVSLERAIEFILSTPRGAHAFLTLPAQKGQDDDA